LIAARQAIKDAHHGYPDDQHRIIEECGIDSAIAKAKGESQ
jgi:hypothetical protein